MPRPRRHRAAFVPPASDGWSPRRKTIFWSVFVGFRVTLGLWQESSLAVEILQKME